MNEEYYLRYQILIFVKNMEHSHNTHQLEWKINQQISDFEKYKSFFGKTFNYLKNNGFIHTGKNNRGNDTVSGLTEKGETVLKFNSWEEYLQNIKSEKQKEKEIKNVDLELKKITLKNQKFLKWTSIFGLSISFVTVLLNIMEKYNLIFVNIGIYFMILFLIIGGNIVLYKKI